MYWPQMQSTQVCRTSIWGSRFFHHNLWRKTQSWYFTWNFNFCSSWNGISQKNRSKWMESSTLVESRPKPAFGMETFKSFGSTMHQHVISSSIGSSFGLLFIVLLLVFMSNQVFQLPLFHILFLINTFCPFWYSYKSFE